MNAASTALGLARAMAAGVDPVGFFRRHATDDSPFVLHFPGLGEVVFFGTAGAARDILSAPVAASQAPLPNPIEPVVGAGSLILLSGEKHRRERGLLMPAFHGERIKSYAETFASATAEEIRPLSPGQSVPVYELAVQIALHVAIRVVFSVDEPGRRRQYIDAVTKLLRANTAPLMLAPGLRREFGGHGPWARLVRLRDHLDQLLSDDMAERRGRGLAGPDMLDVLLSSTDDEGRGRSEQEMHDQLRTLLAAGHETSASSLAWALYHIHRDDSVRERLIAELAGRPSPIEMAALPFLGAVIKESQRMHPPVPIVLRRLTSPLSISGVEYPAGRVVGIALYALHFNPEIWSEPDRFLPERFLDTRVSPFEYAPFGGGHRRCIGAAFAVSEMAVAIGTILTTLGLEMSTRERSAAPPRGVARGIAVAPDREINLTVVDRRDSAQWPAAGDRTNASASD
jgi:cytochrome P450 family 110